MEIEGIDGCAAEFKVSERTIKNWMKEPIPLPIRKTGSGREKHRFDTHEIWMWYCEKRVRQITESKDGKAYDLTSEKSRKESEQADNYAIKNAQLRGELVHVDSITQTLLKISTSVVSTLQSIPGILRIQTTMTNKEIETVKKIIAEKSNEISELKLSES